MISASDLTPASTCAYVYSTRAFSRICALLRPKSPSSRATLRPRLANSTARLTATVVFPTPPLPLVIPITFILPILQGVQTGIVVPTQHTRLIDHLAHYLIALGTLAFVSHILSMRRCLLQSLQPHHAC